MIRALRLEIVRPLGESWDDVGALLRLLSTATPKLLNAGLDAKVAISVVGRDAVKQVVAPKAKAASGDGLTYQAVLRAADGLREWGARKENAFAGLDVPGAMASAISRAACQAFAARDTDTRPTFASRRIIVRGDGVLVTTDAQGPVLALKLRPKGQVRFAVRRFFGAKADDLRAIISGEIPHGDCKLQWDDDRKAWYAYLAYEPPVRVAPGIDTKRVLAVHRGVRNVLAMLSSTGERWLPIPGGKFIAQRHALKLRQDDVKRASQYERGDGAKGRGRSRRYEAYSLIGDKIARVTKTFCQQMGAAVRGRCVQLGCGTVLIEDYGGLESDGATRFALPDRFPFYELKQCIKNALEPAGVELREVPGDYISTTCPQCEAAAPGYHNRRTNTFHCGTCAYERPADWVAAYWLLKRGDADMTVWSERFASERELVATVRSKKERVSHVR